MNGEKHLKIYKYKNENICADDRWTAWDMACKIYHDDKAVLRR